MADKKITALAALSPLQLKWKGLRRLQQDQRLFIISEAAQVRGLMPLLMKHRNGGRWSTEERVILLRDLQALSNLSPYLIPLLMPGGVFMLPVLAWWLDRRRGQSRNATKMY